jgi:tRNA pseudouridine13 synthase
MRFFYQAIFTTNLIFNWRLLNAIMYANKITLPVVNCKIRKLMLDSGLNVNLPFLTASLGGTGGVIREFHDDFFVEEIPLYKASGSGTHTYIFIEKKGLTTDDAIDRISRQLNIRRKDIGYAGLKDARAVTRQWISVEHIEPEKISALRIPNIKILALDRHSNKIKIGHLAGNRFVIKLREMAIGLQQAASLAEQILSVLAQRGVPNYFGLQRFGSRKNSHLLGLAVIKADADEFIDILLGRSNDGDNPAVAAACDFYRQGRYQDALDAWPHVNREQRRTLGTLIKSGGDIKKAFDTFDKHLQTFYISSYQSYLFNMVLAKRMPEIDRLLDGDMACKRDNGACFRVEDAAAEQDRCDNFQISPTGPLLGDRMTELTGPAGQIENAVLADAKLDEKDLRRMKRLGARGGRRPLRFQPRNWKVNCGQDEKGDCLQLEFELDSGCYATMLLREIAKKDFA